MTSSCRTSANSRARISWRVYGSVAFSPVAGAVVVHVLPLFHLADKQAAAMAAVDQSGVREVVLHFPRLVLGASIQQFLNALPTFAGDQRLVRARVRACRPNQNRRVYNRFLRIW